ncbi:hypothetical protein JCM5353_006302 [Sporobolomyces roseus]
MSSHSTSKKPSSKSKKSTTSSAPVSSSSTSKKRSTPLPPPSEDSTSKRAKRSVVGNGKKSLREEELGVGQEIEEEDASEAKAGKGRDRDEEEDEDEDEDDEEGGDGGVTRCVCGDDNEEMSSGLMIQCDTCKCWQHGPCVGLWEEKECPNRYFCELCKPALHGPGGLLRKVSRKSSAPAARRATRSPSVTTSHKGASTSTSHPEPHRTHSKPRESLDSHHSHSHNDARSPSHEEPSHPSKETSKRKKSLGPPGPPPKKRSTMNSRDAAYDDAIALSILEAGGAARRDKLEGRERSDSDSDEDGEERSEGEEKSDEEKEEESLPRDKGRKAIGAAKGKATASKAGAKRTATTGGKGKANGRSSNARSKSELSEQTSLVVPKTEPEHDVDEEQEEAREGEEGEIEESSGRKKRNISPELGGEKESMIVGGEEKEAEKGVEEDEEMRDVEGETAGEGADQAEEAEEAHEASPAPLPIPTIIAPPTTHHTTSRAKHPNQYTYRPKNGATSAPSTSTSASTSSRNPRASPLKGRSHAKDDSTLSVPSATTSKSSKSGTSGGMSKAEKAEREREKKQWASELGIHLGWSMPEHLKHLGYLLPTQTPEPITVPTSASVYAATMQNGGGGSIIGGQYNPLQDYEELSSTFRPTSTDQSDGSGHHFEPPHKVKFPAKRTTMPEMKKRIKSLGEYLDKVRQELADREKKDEVLRRAIEANRMMKSGQAGGEEEMGLSVGGSQALGTSAISEGTLKAMDSLGRELVMFQERFDS